MDTMVNDLLEVSTDGVMHLSPLPADRADG